MDINRDTIFEIFKKNFSFQIVDTIVGKAIKMDALSAFYFCNVTGAGYLDDPMYQFSPKGVMKILRQAFQYNIVTGIFDREKLYYSPTEMLSLKDYLFKGDKYILLKECLSEQEFSDSIKHDFIKLEASNFNSTDFIIFRIEAWKNGNGMECFLEYLACEYFKKEGYIVESQIPITHSVGSPDFGGYKLRNKNKGFHIIELAMLRITYDFEILNNLNIEHITVGEAKTSTTQMAGQLEKYLNTGLFKAGYEMHPNKQAPTKSCFGMLNINDDYSVRVIPPSEEYSEYGDDILNLDDYIIWFENNLKFYIIANLNNEELKAFIENQKPKGKYNQQKIAEVVTKTNIDTIVNYIKEVM